MGTVGVSGPSTTTKGKVCAQVATLQEERQRQHNTTETVKEIYTMGAMLLPTKIMKIVMNILVP